MRHQKARKKSDNREEECDRGDKESKVNLYIYLESFSSGSKWKTRARVLYVKPTVGIVRNESLNINI
jgi:hypothetical protein